MVKLLVESGAQIDNKDKVSTEPSAIIVLSLSQSPPPPHTHTLSRSPSLPLPSVGHALVIASLFCSKFSVKGVEVVGMCA